MPETSSGERDRASSRGPISLAALLTAAVLIAQQVAANSVRDALFLTWFTVTSLPFFVGLSAILAVPAVEAASRLLVRIGSARVSPACQDSAESCSSPNGSCWTISRDRWRCFCTCTRPCSQRLRSRCSGHSLNDGFDPVVSHASAARRHPSEGGGPHAGEAEVFDLALRSTPSPFRQHLRSARQSRHGADRGDRSGKNTVTA